MMYFPEEIFNEIMSYFHSPYRKPPHLDAFKNITAYVQYQKLSRNLMYQESIDRMDMYMHSSLYRFIMDDYSFRRSDCGLQKVWNPFMANYCSRIITPFSESFLDPGFGDSQRVSGQWGVGTTYNIKLVRDFSIILDHLCDNESVPWWF